MKNYVLISAASLMMLAACKDPQQDETVIRQRDSLVNLISERESSVNDLISAFNEVERNLDSVTTRQHIILMNSDKFKDDKLNQKANINSQINAINKLMEANNQKIKELTRKINRSDKKNIQLEKTIVLLNDQLNQKYKELSELNARLNELNTQVAQLQTSVDTLSLQNMAQSQSINEKTTQLHTAYYIVGRSKDLQKSNLIDKKGGLLGIGRTTKLNENIDNNMFTKIDYTETTTIPINSKDMKIVTTHPADSYSIDKTGKTINNLMITDPEKFWSASKYLVVTN